jgi:hypothetical protein
LSGKKPHRLEYSLPWLLGIYRQDFEPSRLDFDLETGKVEMSRVDPSPKGLVEIALGPEQEIRIGYVPYHNQ